MNLERHLDLWMCAWRVMPLCVVLVQLFHFVSCPQVEMEGFWDSMAQSRTCGP